MLLQLPPIMEVAQKSLSHRHRTRRRNQRPSLKGELIHPDVSSRMGQYDTLALFRSYSYHDRADTTDPLSRIQYVDIKTYLSDDILVKVDRASMAVSPEVRTPILDHRFMDLAATIPSSLKLQGMTGKNIFKKAHEGLVPHEVLYRPKMGFGVPLAAWLRGELRAMAHATLFQRREDGLLNRRCVEGLWHEHQSALRNRATELWAQLIFRMWQDKFGWGVVPAPANLQP
jgi:asparagine synthase (glutamine-hydrolysing)